MQKFIKFTTGVRMRIILFCALALFLSIFIMSNSFSYVSAEDKTQVTTSMATIETPKTIAHITVDSLVSYLASVMGFLALWIFKRMWLAIDKLTTALISLQLDVNTIKTTCKARHQLQLEKDKTSGTHP